MENVENMEKLKTQQEMRMPLEFVVLLSSFSSQREGMGADA